jgi:hypothetical protein
LYHGGKRLSMQVVPGSGARQSQEKAAVPPAVRKASGFPAQLASLYPSARLEG